jgi:threonine/homoserine/homoserine lactone efflux protein
MGFLYLLQGIGYGFSAAAQPGPFQAYMISQSLSRGWRRALPVAFAPLLSDGPILVLVLFLLSRVPPALVRILYLAGGLFVLYMAWKALQNWRKFDPAGAVAAAPAEGTVNLWRGAAMNLLNPGPYIYWSLVTGPLLISGWRIAPVNGMGFLAGFYATIVGCDVAIILLFSLARRFGPSLSRLMIGISALALTGFGLYQLWLGVHG